MSILDKNALELRDEIIAGNITSVEVIEEYFKSIEENKDINAYINVDKDLALERARKLDEKIKNKEEVGRLAGLPISIKDNIVTKDFKTTAGSKMMENFKSPYNASIVEKIEEEDGIIIGKTNMDEFAVGSLGNTSYFGPVKNPVDKEKVVGGSSSGSAASVAGKQAVLSVGTDTGGSVRHPASYTGLVGLKPSYGRVSKYGVIPLSATLDTVGTIGRSVEDAVLLFNSILGEDEKDPSSIKSEEIDIDKLKDKSLEGMKIAIPKQFIGAEVERECQTGLSKAIKIFIELGAKVDEIDMPILDEVEKTYHIITSGDFASNMARYDGIRYGHRAKDYETLDELYMNSRSEGLGEEVKKRILFGTYLLSGGRGRKYYDKALLVRRKIINAFDEVYENYDLILGLTSSMIAGDVDKVRSDKYKENENLFMMPANLAGLCAISVPANVDSMPVGIQIMGNRFEEEKMITAALAYERMVK